MKEQNQTASAAGPGPEINLTAGNNKGRTHSPRKKIYTGLEWFPWVVAEPLEPDPRLFFTFGRFSPIQSGINFPISFGETLIFEMDETTTHCEFPDGRSQDVKLFRIKAVDSGLYFTAYSHAYSLEPGGNDFLLTLFGPVLEAVQGDQQQFALVTINDIPRLYLPKLGHIVTMWSYWVNALAGDHPVPGHFHYHIAHAPFDG